MSLPLWRTQLLSLRQQFQQWADAEPRLRHLIIQPLSRGMKLPECMAAHMTANLNMVQKCEVWDWREELPEVAYLYGPLREMKAFRALGKKAWRVLPLDGSDFLTGDGEPSDDWLQLVYLTLRKDLPSFFAEYQRLRLVSGFGLKFAGKEIIYAFDPDDEQRADEFSESSKRFRITALHVDPFTASVAAIDALTTEEAVLSILGLGAGDTPPCAASPDQQEAAKAPAPADPTAGRGIPTASAGAATKDKRTRMTVDEANKKAMQLAKRMRQAFFLISEREQAKQIGCSWTTWKKTMFYTKAERTRVRLGQQAGQKKARASPPVASLTGDLEAVTGEGGRDEVLNRLIAQQQADSEPSPLDDDPPGSRPKKVRSRKRL